MSGVELFCLAWTICGIINILYCVYVNWNLMEDEKLNFRHFATAYLLGPVLLCFGCMILGILFFANVMEVINEQIEKRKF